MTHTNCKLRKIFAKKDTIKKVFGSSIELVKTLFNKPDCHWLLRYTIAGPIIKIKDVCYRIKDIKLAIKELQNDDDDNTEEYTVKV